MDSPRQTELFKKKKGHAIGSGKPGQPARPIFLGLAQLVP